MDKVKVSSQRMAKHPRASCSKKQKPTRSQVAKDPLMQSIWVWCPENKEKWRRAEYYTWLDVEMGKGRVKNNIKVFCLFDFDDNGCQNKIGAYKSKSSLWKWAEFPFVWLEGGKKGQSTLSSSFLLAEPVYGGFVLLQKAMVYSCTAIAHCGS